MRAPWEGPARVLDGKATAAAIKQELRARVAALRQRGCAVGLGTVLVGEDPGSLAYVAGKHRDCAEVGIDSIRIDLPADVGQGRIEEAVAQLNADPACTGYIVQLPLPAGIDTVYGTKGTYVSGGEAQRLAIARALLQDAPIIVLDEATAFADAENEYKIKKTFDVLLKDKTVIMIAHRLSSVVNADKICVINEGKIAEEGTHAELLERRGLYAAMWNNFKKGIEWKV